MYTVSVVCSGICAVAPYACLSDYRMCWYSLNENLAVLITLYTSHCTDIAFYAGFLLAYHFNLFLSCTVLLSSLAAFSDCGYIYTFSKLGTCRNNPTKVLETTFVIHNIHWTTFLNVFAKCSMSQENHFFTMNLQILIYTYNSTQNTYTGIMRKKCKK